MSTTTRTVSAEDVILNLESRLKAVTKRSNNRKNALRSLAKAHERSVFMNRDLINRLTTARASRIVVQTDWWMVTAAGFLGLLLGVWL